MLTFQWLDDLQAVGQVGPGSSRGAAGVARAAVGVVGTGGGSRAGGQAVIGGEEAAGALALVACGRGQGVQLALALHVEEGPVGGVALLTGRQAAQRRLQVLATRRTRLAKALRPAGAAGFKHSGHQSADHAVFHFIKTPEVKICFFVPLQEVINRGLTGLFNGSLKGL